MLAGADCGITLLSWVAYQRICSGVSWEESAAPDRAAASKLIFNAATMWTGYAIRSYLSPPIFTAQRRLACDSASRSYHVLRLDPRSRHPLRRLGRVRGERLSRSRRMTDRRRIRGAGAVRHTRRGGDAADGRPLSPRSH